MVREVSSSSVLAAWEQGYGLGPAGRGMAMLAIAMPGESTADLAQLTVGQRDRLLITLRMRLFGDELRGLDACPRCAARVETTHSAAELCLPPIARDADVVEIRGTESTGADFHLQLRLPTSADLLVIEGLSDPASRRQTLVRRCIVGDWNAADDVAVDGPLTAELISAAAQRFAEEDPQADIRFRLECHACGQTWSSRFDIVTFLWAEIDAWAQRLLAEVHALAGSYGWSEREILALSPWRRQIYLEMLRR